MSTGPNRPPVAGIQGFDGIGGADDPADLDVELKNGTNSLQAFSHSWVIAGSSTPLLGELGEALLGHGLGSCGVDRADVFGDLVPVPARRVAKHVAQQMNIIPISEERALPLHPDYADISGVCAGRAGSDRQNVGIILALSLDA